VVRTYGWGRHVGRLDLFIKDPTRPYNDNAKIKQIADRLSQVDTGIRGGNQSLQGMRKDLETRLQHMNEENRYQNELVLLSRQLREDLKVKKIVDEYNRIAKQAQDECPEQ